MRKLLVVLSFIMLICISVSINAEVTEIPLNEINEIAIRNAKQMWGDVYADEAIPLYDQFANLISYQFNFSLGKPFPKRSDLIGDCKKEPKALWNVTWAAENFAQMEIGARTDKPVVWGYSKGLSYDYTYYTTMEKIVAKHLNKEFQIIKMVSISFGNRWFVISDGEDEYYIKAMGEPEFKTEEEFTRWAIDLDNIKENQDFSLEWDEFRNGRVLNRNDVHIPNHEEMPFYQWIYGCTPCSASMICAWWDCNSVNAANYSLLIDLHWAEWDEVQGSYDYHVPDAVADLANRMDTWGGSGATMPWNTDDETEDFIEDNGYDAWCNSYYWLWDYWSDNEMMYDMINEINNGYPPHVGIWGHSIAGMGYNYSNSDFIFHDPNYSTIQNRDISDVWQISKFHLSGSFGVPLEIISPDGGQGWSLNGTGENWNCGNVHQIKWETEVLPYPTVYAKIWYSTEAGTGHLEYDWNLITASTPNDGEYNWDIPLGVNSTECRIRVEVYNNIDESMWGSDGSYGNFTITSGGAINNLSSGNSEMMSEIPVEFFTFMQPEPAWAVVAARKGADNDRCGLTLYDSDDFNSPIVTSNYGSTINLIVIDRNHLPEEELGVKAFITDGSDVARVEYEGEDDQLIVGTNPVENFNGGDVAKMYDVTLTPGTYTINLNVLSGNANLDFGLYSSQEGVYFGPMGYGTGTPLLMNMGSANGSGEDEQIVVTIENTDVYGLCVWSNYYALASFRIDFDSPGEWTGTENSSWGNANNWASGIIPDRYENVLIPAGTPHSPRIYSGMAGITKGLTIAEGASLEVASGTLDVYATANIYGNLEVSQNDSDIEFRGHVRLYENSHFYDSGSASITVNGSWTADAGADVDFDQCTIYFVGAESTMLNIYSNTHEFHHFQVIKDTGRELIFGSTSTNNLVVNGQLYIGSNATFRILNENPVITESVVSSYGKLEFEMGELVFAGSSIRQVRFNSQDVLHAFTIQNGCSVIMVTNIYLKGYMTINGGELYAAGHTITTESSWSNTGGTFIPDGAVVTFSGSGNNQYVNEDGFEELHLNKIGGGDLVINNGKSVTCNSFEWTSGNVRVNGGSFTANDLADVRVMGHYYLDGGTIDLHQGTTSSEYVDLDADIWIYDGTFNIHGGYDYPSEWAYTRAITVYMEDGILDFKDNGIWLSETGNYFDDVISGGTIRTSGDFKVDRSFTPTGGIVELYGNGTAYLHGNEDCNFHNIIVNKGSTTREGSNRDDRFNRVIIDEDTAVTQDVIVHFGGFMQLSSATLTIGDDLQFYGGLNMDAADEIIEVGDDVTWFNGSSATVTDGEFHVNGNWLFYNGINCEFEASNTVYFIGDEQSIIKCYSDVATFGSIIIDKNSSNCEINDYNNNTVKLSGDLLITSNNIFDVNGNELDVTGVIDIYSYAEFDVDSGADVTTGEFFMQGEMNMNGGNFTITDNFIQYSSGELTINNGNFIIDNPYEGSMESFSGTTTLHDGNFQITNNGIQFGASSNFQHLGGTIKIGWGFRAISSGIFQQDTGTIELIGNRSATINLGSNNWFNDLIINKDLLSNQVMLMNDCVINNDLTVNGGHLKTSGNDFTINGNISIGADGRLDSDSGLIIVIGDWENLRGSDGFYEENGTVRFIGSTISEISTDETFYNLVLQKTTGSMHYSEIAADKTVTVENNFNINDGKFLLRENSTLDVDQDLILQNDTALRTFVNESGINIYIGHHLYDYNTDNIDYTSFIPGISTVTFDGSLNQICQSARTSYDFHNLIIDQTADYFYPNNNLIISGGMSVTDGCWNNPNVGMTHTFQGDVTIGDNGWNSNMGNVVFSGAEEATYQKGSGVVHHNITIDKIGSREAETLTLLSGLYMLWEGDLVINSGTLDANGNTLSCSGNVTINGGKLALDDNSLLRVGNAKSLSVNSGGTLETIGSAGNEVSITCYNANNYHDVHINANGTISAEHTIFQYMSVDGVYVKYGSIVDPSHAFNYCTFQEGEPEGTENSYLLQVRNEQDITMSYPVFPTNTWNSSYNIRKANNAGSVEVVEATGDFAGESYDLDPYNRVNWTLGPNISVTPSSHDFGDVIIGNSERNVLYIENTGGSTLTGTITTPEGYTVIDNSRHENPLTDLRNVISYSVEAGIAEQYLVDFEPTEIQTYSGNIIITHNAGGAVETVFVTGNGIDAPPPEIVVFPETIYFGDLFIGEVDTLQLSVYNPGGRNLVGSITAPAGFTITEMLLRNNSSSSEISSEINTSSGRNIVSFVVLAEDMIYFNVIFEPLILQDYTDNLVFTHNAAGDDVLVPCIGRGVEAVFSISPVTIHKTITSGQTGSELLTFGNNGNIDINYIAYIDYEGAATTIIDESFEGSFPPTGWSLQSIDGWGDWIQSSMHYYSGSNSAQASIMDANNARLITPFFTATEDCILKYWIKANENFAWYETNEGEFLVEVSTDGTNWTTIDSYSQEILNSDFVPKGVALGDYAGQNIKIAFRVYENYSGRGVNIDDVKITGDASPTYSWLSLNTETNLNGEIATGAPDVDIQVGFDTAGLSDGNYFAYIRTISNDTTDPEYDIQVAMDVGYYDMTLSTQLLAFGNVNVGESDSLQFTIENTGTLVLDGTITPPDGYTATENFSRDLKNRDVLYYHIFPGNNFTYDITFEPPTHGNYDGNITITHNMGGADELISVTGVGKASEIVVSPDFLLQEQQPEATNYQDLTIDNIGNNNLSYSASITYYSRSRDILVSSGFEEVNFPPTGWTTEIVSSGGDWMQDGMYPNSGIYCAWADGFMIEDARLITPSFIATDDCQLSYYIKTDEWAMYGGSFGVEVSTDGMSWSFIDEIDISTLTGTYSQEVLSLSAYNGNSIQVAFRLYDNQYYSSDAIYIDDVEIGGSPAPTDQWLTLDGGETASGTVGFGRTADIISVGFDSTNLLEGYYMADIVIDSNDPQMPQYTLMAELNVGIPQISVYPDSVGFGPIEVGEEFTNFFTIENMGTMSLIGTITAPNGYTIVDSVVRRDGSNHRNILNYEIISGFMQQFNLTFAPTEAVEYSGNVIITHNAAGNDVLIEVTGEGASAPIVTTNEVTNITTNTATGGGNVINDGGSFVYSRGICWSVLEEPTIYDNVNYEGSGADSFVSEIDSLTAGITYYVRAFAENFYGLSYGNQVSFNTIGAAIIVSPGSLPDFGEITVDATSSEQSYNVSGENLESDIEIFAPTGFEISLTSESVRNNLGSENNQFSSRNRDFGDYILLTPVNGTVIQTTIYVRFHPSAAVQYSESIWHISMNSEEISVEVSGDGIELPEATTNPITDIEANSATGGGEVTYDGNSNISARGVCWSTSTNPTIADSLTEDGTGLGEFTSSLTNLAFDTLYYVRAYAANSMTTVYGNEVSFTTAAPTIFVSYSELNDFGDVVINTQSPEQSYYLLGYDLVEDVFINAPTGFEISLDSESRDFGSQITLSPIDGEIAQTTIYVRFSPTTAGNYYGNITHESSSAETKYIVVNGAGITTATVMTDVVTEITQTTATGGGEVLDDGNSDVTACGVCWSLSVSPTIADEHTTDSSGTGTFISSLVGLDSGTLYYVRAYAVNAVGTVYGAEVTFTTLDALPPDPPANLTIEISGMNVVLNWDIVDGADSYSVYSSDDPELALASWTLEEEVTNTTWDETIPVGKKFYYVTSNTLSPTRE